MKKKHIEELKLERMNKQITYRETVMFVARFLHNFFELNILKWVAVVVVLYVFVYHILSSLEIRNCYSFRFCVTPYSLYVLFAFAIHFANCV